MLNGNMRSDEPRTLNEPAGEFVKLNWKLPLGSTAGFSRVGGVALRFTELEANKVSEA